MLTLLEYQNTSYLLLTLEDLALPNTSFSGCQASDHAAQLVGDSGSVTLSLSALRGTLNCPLVLADNIAILHGPIIHLGCEYSTNPIPWPVRVWSSLSPPPGCHLNSIDSSYLHSYQSNPSIHLNASFSFHTNVPLNIMHPPFNNAQTSARHPQTGSLQWQHNQSASRNS
jgi:hypothetical protein